MPSAVILPQTPSPLDVLLLATTIENQELGVLPAVGNDALPTGGQGVLNQTTCSNVHNASTRVSSRRRTRCSTDSLPC